MSTLGQRVKEAREAVPMTQEALARAVGVSQGLIGQIESGKNQGSKHIASLARVLNVSADWLETGMGSRSRVTTPHGGTVIYGRPITTYNSLDELPPESTIMITHIDVALSAGNGRETWHIEELTPLPFQADYIRRLDATPKNLVAVKVRGDSMEPRLFDGDTVVVDKADRRIPASGGVFALVYSGEMLVKQLFKQPDGSLRVVSDNKDKYDPFTVPTDQLEYIEIVGRVKYRSGMGNF
ncbi:XRE family transcriptional regulator [Ralstonia nicotianae]